MASRGQHLTISGPNLWYLVGLVTSDGSLSCDGRHIDVTSKNYQFLYELKSALKLKNKIGIKNKGKIYQAYHIQLSNKTFYNFLLTIGLMPNKTSRLGAIKVPDKYFCDFLRGLIDGDGNIRRWIHPSNGREQWVLRIYIGSKYFAEWLQGTIEKFLQAKGRVHIEERELSTQPLYILKYGKIAAKVILKRCYYSRAFSMKRKARLARECLASRVGWKQSKTVVSF